MVMREYQKTDYDKCKALCEKYGVAFRVSDFTIVAENSTGDIVAFANISYSIIVEPLISDNNMTTVNMLDFITKQFKGRPIFGFVSNENKKFTNMLSKMFSVLIHKNKNIVEM